MVTNQVSLKMYQHVRQCSPVHTCLRGQWACRLQTPPNRRRFFTTGQSLLLGSYADTLPALRINSDTRVIFQGFTGKQATANAKDSLAWGTKIVGGVTPGRTGEHLGLPVLPSVRQAMEQLKPDATAIYVAAHQAPGAIQEAIEAEVPLIVAVAEHIPVHDMLRIHSMLKTQSKSRLVGPNSPGIISAIGKCRIGFQPLPCFSPGRVGIVAKSGTLSYETVASTTRAGLGQSLCIGIGGDMAPGTDMVEALSVLEQDPDTKAIALIGEIGGMGELEAAAWIKKYNARNEYPKPIVGLIAGVNEAPGRIMGHAGAFTFLGEPDAKAKNTALEEAGVTLVNHPAKIGDILKTKLRGTAESGMTNGSNPFVSGTQRRQLHSMRAPGRRPLVAGSSAHKTHQHQQRRSIYLDANQCFDELRARGGINCGPYSGHGTRRLLAVGIDRSARSPAILVGPFVEDWIEEAQRTTAPVKSFPFDYRRGPDDFAIERIASHIQLSNKGDNAVASLRRLIKTLTDLFYEKEGLLLTTHIVERLGEIKVVHARFAFDQATYRNGTPPDKIKAMQVRATAEPAEIEAEKSGIVYVKLPGDDATIGTLVNGAGLAMNTVDALADAGGKATNFLDTGGKATSETVKESFRIILQDPRVKVAFVNIFGGLTLGDMIARGIIMAFQELSLAVPVVVRIRGTNEKEGQKLIADSQLPLYAFDDFEEAAAKAIELSRK